MVKVKVTPVQALRLCTGRTACRGCRGVALPFLDSTRKGWVVSVMPRPLFTPRKYLVEHVWNVMAHAQKPDLVFQRNGQVHLNWRGSVHSTAGSRGVRISEQTMDGPCSEAQCKSSGYPLQSAISPSLPLPHITMCNHVSNGLYWLYRRLCGPQGWSGQVRKISPPPGLDPRTVQPIASHYSDYATWRTLQH